MMKPQTQVISLVFALISISMASCRRESSIDSSLFSVEVIDGARCIHNHKAQRGDVPGARLELLGKIGKLEAEEEKDMLYDPVDAARLPNGDILILERGGSRVKRYDKKYQFVSAFGQKGQGPGDFTNPFCLRLNRERDRLYVGHSRISRFSLDGTYEGGFSTEKMPAFGSIGVESETSGMAVLSGARVILPSRPSIWLDSGADKLLSVYDQKGTIIGSFGAVKKYDDPGLMVNANIVHFAADADDNVYVVYAYQNRIDKYSPEGEIIFSADRPLRYEVRNITKEEIFKSGAMEKKFSWPSVTSVAKGIGFDNKNRIWVLTFLKQPNRFLTFDEKENWADCYEFEVFDSDGILLFKVAVPNVRFDNFSIYDDRLYLIDSEHESCVYEYRIVEENERSR